MKPSLGSDSRPETRVSLAVDSLGRVLRRSLVLVPFLTLILGMIVSLYVYTTIRRHELEFQARESMKRAQEIVDQVDLRIANSLLRIQSYEEYIGTRVNDYRRESQFLRQALKHTVFQRLSIFRIGAKSANDMQALQRVFRVEADTRDTQSDEPLPTPRQRTMQNDTVRQAVLEMRQGGESLRSVFHEFGGRPLFAVVIRSTSNNYMIYSATARRLFQHINLRPNEVILLRDPVSTTAWILRGSETGKTEISSRSNTGDDFFAETSPDMAFFKGLPQSGLKVDVRFSTKGEDAFRPFSLATTAGIFGLLTTVAIAALFWILLSQNKRVSSLVVERTRDLVRAHDEVQEALMVKTRFIGSVSHEIRTPLNLILGMIDLCEEKERDLEIREYLKSMRTSGNHLLEMINDLLGLARSESSDIKLQSTPVNLIQFLDEIGRVAGRESAKKGLRMHVVVSPDLPSVIKSDPSRLRQILLNLLKNAFKYTNQGFVTLQVSPSGPIDGNRQRVRFDVIDSGIGIPADKVARIFDAFFQLDSAHLLSEGGVGLGLSIVKELVQKMNGQVEVLSKVGTGSRFRVELNLDVVEAETWVGRYEIQTEGKIDVAIVSSDHNILDALRPLGGHPLIDLSTVDANRIGEIDRHQWVVVDGGIGQETLRKVFEKHDRRHLVLLGTRNEMQRLYPGLAIPDDVMVVNGCPIAINDILISMGFSSRRRRPRLPSSMTVRGGAAGDGDERDFGKLLRRPLRILVADDDDGNRQLYVAYFKGAAWDIHYAEDGQQGWERFEKNRYDLMILDVRMPVMDGLQLSRKIRDFEQEQKRAMTPILLVTADALDGTVAQANTIPASTYLTKPVRKPKLLSAIEEVIETVGSSDGAEPIEIDL